MTDHDLMVCPTVSPKYSFTSQNPASLTWLKNSDPQPIASTSRESSAFGRSAAMPVTMPPAVMVATVARPGGQPHAHRDQPAEHEHRQPGVGRPVADHVAHAGLHQHLLDPPRAATISRIPAIVGRPPPRESRIPSWLMPVR